MKVVGPTCALKSSKVGGEDVVRCLSDQSLAISKCKIPLLDEQMSMFLQDMNSCYSKLKELVPTLPTNKKASKMEILQHVIDYIWDLQVELDSKKNQSSPPRTPLTTLNAELAGISVEVNIQIACDILRSNRWPIHNQHVCMNDSTHDVSSFVLQNGCSDDRIMCR